MVPVRELILSLGQTESTHSDTDGQPFDYEQNKADYYNSLPGTLQNYDCDECKNKGVIAYVSDGIMVTKGCRCIEIRKHYWNIKKSGLFDVITQMTFEKFEADEQWQELMKSKAVSFSENPHGWMFIAGQSGCGKTHLATAVCGKLLESGKQVMYIKWVQLVKKLKALRFKDELYENVLQELKRAEVLYIDDFLKEDKPSMDIAYEVIDLRYTESSKITLITSETFIDTVMELDEAVAGRIRERAEGHIVQILKAPERNYRMRGKK